jgi:hypothetical protein
MQYLKMTKSNIQDGFNQQKMLIQFLITNFTTLGNIKVDEWT